MQMFEDLIISHTLTATDPVIECGFSPRVVEVVNNATLNRFNYLSGAAASVKTNAADGVVSAAAGAIVQYAGNDRVKYNDATVPSYKNAETGAAIAADKYISILGKSVYSLARDTVTEYAVAPTLEKALPKLASITDNGNSYVTKPGVTIDSSAVGSVGEVIVIRISR